MLEVGLIGIGGMGAVHAKVYRAMKEKVTLAAIADLDTEKAQRLVSGCAVTVYRDAYEMLAKETLDFADICLPTALCTLAIL